MALSGVLKSLANRAAWGAASARHVPGTADVRATLTAYPAADLVERLHRILRRRERIAGYVCCTHRPLTDGAILSRTERPELAVQRHSPVRFGRLLSAANLSTGLKVNSPAHRSHPLPGQSNT